MAIRATKQYSDRGRLSDLAAISKNYEKNEQILKPLPSELRMKQLYEYANLNNDNDLESAIGFITTEYISDKNALPLSIYRLRKIVADIRSKSGSGVDQFAQEFSVFFREGLSDVLGKEYIKQKAMIKAAWADEPPLFWRVDKS